MQRPGTRGLGLAGVRALVQIAVAAVDTQRAAVVEPQHARAGDDAERRQPCRDKVKNIVHFRRKLA